MIPAFPILYFSWKAIHKTRIHKPIEVDLIKDLAVIEAYEQQYTPTPPK